MNPMNENPQIVSVSSLILSPLDDRRNCGLGSLYVLYDELIFKVLEYLIPKELLTLSIASPILYLFCQEEDLWKDYFLKVNDNSNGFKFRGSWKLTTLFAKDQIIPDHFQKPPHRFEGIYSLFLYKKWYLSNVNVENFGTDLGMLERKSANDFNVQDFIDNYDFVSRPLLITDCTTEWNANNEWKKEKLLQRFGDTLFKVSDRGKKKLKITLNEYFHYIQTQRDQDPLYIFDSGFGERMPSLLNDYSIPKYFTQDYFEVLGNYRPSYRWLVIGPPRSGASWHLDPAATSAWNALISGHKRWLLYPPNCVPPGVFYFSEEDTGKMEWSSPSSLQWLLEVYPTLSDDMKPLECIQNPGETIFIPSGWWHMVLNLDETVAVTQNFTNEQNIDQVCEDIISDKNGFYEAFKERLLRIKPNLNSAFEDFEIVYSQSLSVFDDIEFWTPHALQVCQIHSLSTKESNSKRIKLIDNNNNINNINNESSSSNNNHSNDLLVSTVESGENPIFFVGEKYVVKFYSHEYGGESTFINESMTYHKIIQSPYLESICPKFLGSGKISIPVPSSEPSTEKKKLQLKSANSIMNEGEECMENLQSEETKIEKNRENTAARLNETIWPYIVLSYVDAWNLMIAREEGVIIDNNELVQFVAKAAKEINSLNVVELPSFDPFIQFLSKQRRNCFKNHWTWRSLPHKLLLQLDCYINKNTTTLVGDLQKIHLTNNNENLNDINNNNNDNNNNEDIEWLVWLHADITDENLVGDLNEISDLNVSKKRNSVDENQSESHEKNFKRKMWHPKHILDFGDSMIGDVFYELVSIFFSVFQCHKKNFRIFLECYSPKLMQLYHTHKEKWIYKAMSYTLLHKCDSLRTVFRYNPSIQISSSLEELALKIWSLDD